MAWAENAAFAQYFIGQSYLIPLTRPADGRELHPGDVVVIPPEVKHWHGAAQDAWFAHLSIEVPGEDTGNEWCQPMADEVYQKLF